MIHLFYVTQSMTQQKSSELVITTPDCQIFTKFRIIKHTYNPILFYILTVINPDALSYVYSYLARLHSDKYCVGLVMNLPAFLCQLFLDFLAIHDNLSNSIILLFEFA